MAGEGLTENNGTTPRVNEGDPEAALRRLQDLLRRSPDDPLAHNDLGVLYYRKGQKRAALEHFTASLRLDPLNPATMKNTADVCLSLGLVDQAKRMYAFVLNITPGDQEALTALQSLGANGGSTPDQSKSIVVDGTVFPVLDHPSHTERAELISLYWNHHPRYKFLKGVPKECKLLDIGAGPGGLIYWPEWLPPKRSDIRMYAIDMVKGELFDRYVDYQICDLDKDAIKYGSGFFDVILLSHVLEHIQDERRFLKEARRVLRTGGRFYIEVPTPGSQNLPHKQLFFDQGIDVSTVNFFDDATHKRTFDLDTLSSLLREAGFAPLEMGVIENKYLEDDLFTYGITHNDHELNTYAVWSKLRFAHFITSEAV